MASSLHDWGGIERYVAYLKQGLEARGHVVDVACPPGSPLAERVGGIPIVCRGRTDIRAYLAYRRLLNQGRYDVVHCHFSPDFTMPGLAARHAKQGGKVMSRHVVLPWSGSKAQRYLQLWPNIVPVSDAVRRVLEASGIPNDQMTVARAGVPEPVRRRNREETRASLNLREDEFTVGSFGRLVAEKGTDGLIRAISRSPGLRARIYGDGPERKPLEALAQSLQVNERVTFAGRIDEVSDHMAAMDAVVIPSLWEEAFPYAALEAFAVGVPVVAAATGGMPEMVSEGVNGMLVPKGDDEALATALTWLAKHPEVRARMASGASASYAGEYTLGHMAERFEAAYRAILNRERG